MHAFDVLGDPVRRRILELLATGETSAGDVAARVGGEFGISQPAVSQHLKVLRAAGLVDARVDGRQRMYGLQPAPLAEVDAFLAPYRAYWSDRLDALERHLEAHP